MPKNYYRSEVRFSDENRASLSRLLEETREKTGKFVSMSELVDEIVTQFFEKTKKPLQSGTDVVHTSGQQEGSSS